MKSNLKDLGHISVHWNSTYEGCLKWKQKTESRRKGNFVYSDHWCRLKGNLFVLCRSKDRLCTDVAGFVILERHTVTQAENEAPHAIRIEFSAGDPSLILIAPSGSEADTWYHHLSDAQLNPTLERILLIRKELSNLHGCDPLETGKSHKTDSDINSTFNMTSAASNLPNPEGIELYLSCDDLSIELLNIGKNSDIQILVSIQSSNKWMPVGATEVVKHCSNPYFSKPVHLRSGVFDDDSRVRFELSNVRDSKSNTCVKLGLAMATVEQLLACESTHLPILDPSTRAALGQRDIVSVPKFVILAVKHEKCISTDEENADVPDNLSLICDNILSKRYTFRHTLGDPMHVIEYMGDSVLCFDFPMEYLKSLIPQERLMFDSLSRIGSSDPQLEGLRKEMLITMRQSLEQYEISLRYLVDCSGMRFKPCHDRLNTRYDFVPSNLQVCQIAVTDRDLKTAPCHIITTVGAFSTASRSYKAGGLFRQAATLRCSPHPYPPTHFTISELCRHSPIAGAVTLYEISDVGRAKFLLYKGANIVNLLRTHLSGLTQRLSARDQAEPLAERFKCTFLSFEALLNDALLNKLDIAQLMRSQFNELIKLLTHISVLDKSHDTVSLVPVSKPVPNEASHTLHDRNTLMQALEKASSMLSDNLDHSWDSVAETLWSCVLKGLISLIRTSSHDTLSSTAVSLNGLTPSALMTEAERTIMNRMTVDNPYTALAILYDFFAYRHHACVCQALTTVLSTLLATMTYWDHARWKQVAVCGLLTQFEGLLSCYGNEQGIMEDWCWAAEQLTNIRIVIRPIILSSSIGDAPSQADGSHESIPMARMTGVRECELHIPWSLWSTAPNEIQVRGRVRLRIHPICFNVGINEQQTVAEKLDKIGVQQAINVQGLCSLESYFERYIKHYGAPPKSASDQDVCDLITNIRHLINLPTRQKPVELLECMSEITQTLGGLRFTSCKSAKDRTAMSITLEQIRWLKNSEGMHENQFLSALNCIRRNGLRLDNVFKNTGGRKYAFNHLQLLSFPKIYRPPAGTYSPGWAT